MVWNILLTQTCCFFLFSRPLSNYMLGLLSSFPLGKYYYELDCTLIWQLASSKPFACSNVSQTWSASRTDNTAFTVLLVVISLSLLKPSPCQVLQCLPVNDWCARVCVDILSDVLRLLHVFCPRHWVNVTRWILLLTFAWFQLVSPSKNTCSP